VLRSRGTFTDSLSTLVQKEIARAVYIVLHDQVDFNHTFKGQPLSKRKAPQWPHRASPDV